MNQEREEAIRAMRGLVVGLAISGVFWAGVAILIIWRLTS